MTPEQAARADRVLNGLFVELADARTPDYLEAAIERASSRPQRPAWTYPGRWLPMADIASRPAFVPRTPWRTIGVALVVLALVVALAVAFVGSRPQKVPAPFGPAANGSLLFADGGDIYKADPGTGKTTAVVVGPETDVRPVWSLDGTRFAFERKVTGSSGQGLLFVAGADGRAPVQVTPGPLIGLADWVFSPDGRSIATFADVDGAMVLAILPSDGSGQMRTFAVSATADDGAPRYRPDGSEIMFIGKDPSAAYRGVYGLDPTSGRVRTIVAPMATLDIHGASWSPDGTRIAYGTVDQGAVETSARAHIVSADGTSDVTLDTDPDRFADFGLDWSNDATRLILTGFYRTANGEATRSVVVPVDRSGPGIAIECPPGSPSNRCDANWVWSPDDKQLIAVAFDDGNQPIGPFIADPLTGKVRPAPWTATADPAWQRVAP
jgi:dipeptidyl aminopeptidase/acylaminoacyl peptidase